MARRRKALFTRGVGNAKTRKALKLANIDTLILHLAPHRAAGGPTVCTSASAGCMNECLFKWGRAEVFTSVNARRIERTRKYHADPAAFVARLSHEITLAERRGRPFVVRVNGTSDLPKVALALAARHPAVTFYDYTKHARPWTRQRANYHLTFSRTEANDADCFDALAHGVNVAVVFDTKKGQALPATYYGVPVIDGDITDLRYLDPRGVVVGLRAKGRSRRDQTGFVVKVATLPTADRAVAA